MKENEREAGCYNEYPSQPDPVIPGELLLSRARFRLAGQIQCNSAAGGLQY